MGKRIGLFGGTFDPPHNGHRELAHLLGERLQLDSVVLMPTFIPPHKYKTEMASAVDRLAMCRLLCEGDPLLTVSDREINRRGASYTVQTLEELTAAFPTAEWFLLTGADMFLTLSSWYRFADIAAMATLCTLPRNGVTAEELRAHAATLEAQGARCYVADATIPSISSTQVRESIKAGSLPEDLVPPAVEAYIRKQHLYTGEAPVYASADEQYTAIIRGRLTPRRFEHSLAVAAQAEYLAKKYGANPQKAKTAGLLHDILKDTDRDSLLQIVRDFGILLDAVELRAPKLWHAHVGAVFIEKILGVTDPGILNAVRYHTTGRAGMSRLETVLYLADFTSADRDYDDVDVMRRLTEQDIGDAMRYALAYTIDDLRKQGREVHPDTEACYREWTERMNANGEGQTAKDRS